MSEMRDFPFAMIQKFHKFSLSTFPLPLPEGELVTLTQIHDANLEAGLENTSISLLAQREHVSVPTISRCLSRLEEKGLVFKQISPADRRSICVGLTDRGQEVYQEAFLALKDFVGRSLSHIEEAELKQFFATLDKIYDAFSLEYKLLEKGTPQEQARD